MRSRGAVRGLGLALVALAGAALAQDRPTDPHALPAGHGWFCYTEARPDGGTTGSCVRTHAACERGRGERSDMGSASSACSAAASAFCMTLIGAHGAPGAVCRPTREACDAFRDALIAVNREQGRRVFRNISTCDPTP